MLHFTNEFTVTEQYAISCILHVLGAAAVKWLRSWLAEQGVRGSIHMYSVEYLLLHIILSSTDSV